MSDAAISKDDKKAGAAAAAQTRKIEKSDAEWRQQLTPEQYHILREKGTEWAFTGEYHDHKKDGVYTCAGCGLPLYDSKAKFDSGTGWPSYYEAIASDRVDELRDGSLGMVRTELVRKAPV